MEQCDLENIFISYKRKEVEWVTRLVVALENYGYTVWWDSKIEVGEEYSNIINHIISKVDCILVVWSKESIQSSWVISEAMVGFERQNIIPILKEEVTPPIPFNTIQSADLICWDGDVTDTNFKQLINSIQKYVSLSSERDDLMEKEKGMKDESILKKTTLLSVDFEAKKWEDSLLRNTQNSYKDYLNSYPNGKYQKRAMKKLRTFSIRKQIFLSVFIIGVLTVLLIVKKLGE